MLSGFLSNRSVWVVRDDDEDGDDDDVCSLPSIRLEIDDDDDDDDVVDDDNFFSIPSKWMDGDGSDFSSSSSFSLSILLEWSVLMGGKGDDDDFLSIPLEDSVGPSWVD